MLNCSSNHNLNFYRDSLNKGLSNAFKGNNLAFNGNNLTLKTLNKDTVTFSGVKKVNKSNYEINIQQTLRDLLPKAPDLTQDQVDDALRSMGNKFLKGVYKTDYSPWSPEIPTVGYCYIVTEFAHYFVDPDTKAFHIKYDDNTTHWFLEKPNGKKIDFTLTQFKGEDPEYERAVAGGFLTNFPSKRACEIAIRLGMISREAAEQIPKLVTKLNNVKNKEEETAAIAEFKSILNKS